MDPRVEPVRRAARGGAGAAVRVRLAFRAAAAGPALAIYRERFKPSAQLAAPYVMVGVNIIAAETDAEARRLATSQQMSFVDILRGTRGRSSAADRRHRHVLAAAGEGPGVADARAAASSGAPRRWQGLDALVARTQADELMVVSDMFDFDTRLQSFELIAEAAAAVGASSPL